MSAPIVLVVLDGFGIGDGGAADATALAQTPFFAHARATYPSATLETSGEFVGLPPGQMGNSEVGHMTMGSGRTNAQDITRITEAIAGGELANNAPIQAAIDAVQASGGTLHLMGLVSDGGVHSEIHQLALLIDHLTSRGIQPAVHAFTDGRDTPPHSGSGFMRSLVSQLERVGGHVATVSGRFYGMDRDNRWDRIQKAYDAIVCGEGRNAGDPIAAVEDAYQRGESDEFIEPTVIDGGARLVDGDAMFCFNYRADRVREITNVLTGVDPAQYAGQFDRKTAPKLNAFVCLTEYDANFNLPVAFPSDSPRNGLGEIISGAGLSQLRVAETEKYAHVTFFFNGGLEEPFPGEDRILILSPRDVATYDDKPEMSAAKVTEEAVHRIADDDYAFVLINYANPDMVGHTGVLGAAIKAVETVDSGLDQLAKAVLAKEGSLLVTADHGNCEMMVDPESGEPHTAHTTNPVPVFWVANDTSGRHLRDGSLADIAPTILDLMGLSQSEEMTGRSLIVQDS
jgi:2,3-bisphosphoglycerate-independent phosphoglycerate mutase